MHEDPESDTPSGMPLLTLILAMGMSPSYDCNPDSPAVAEIRAVATGIIEADNARDIERVLAYYAVDAVWLPPDSPVIAGRDAFRERYEALFDAFDPQIELRIDDACVDGELGFVRGHNGGRLVSREGGEDRALNDAYLMVLRREDEGWRISHLMWHASPPDDR